MEALVNWANLEQGNLWQAEVARQVVAATAARAAPDVQGTGLERQVVAAAHAASPVQGTGLARQVVAAVHAGSPVQGTGLARPVVAANTLLTPSAVQGPLLLAGSRSSWSTALLL